MHLTFKDEKDQLDLSRKIQLIMKAGNSNIQIEFGEVLWIVFKQD